MPAGMSFDQMVRVPFILRMITRIHAPGNTMSQYYGLGITPRGGTQQIIGNAGQYDIFDGTRSLSTFSAKGAPPTRLNRKQIGTVPITVPRQYNSIGLEDDKMFGVRGLGQPFSQPTATFNKAYFTRQIQYAKQRMNNTHEFMTAHMFRGGWTVVPYGSVAGSPLLFPGELGASGAIYTNSTQVPASHRDDLDAVLGGTQTPWDDPQANIIKQLMALQVIAARENGRRITDIWLNGNTAAYLFTNSVIQAVGGSVYKIFDTLNPATEIGPNQEFPDTGVTVVFRGLPDYKFHIYNQGYVTPGTSESFSAQTDTANWNYFIPDDYAIFTPPPGDWCEMVQGSEPMQWNLLERQSQVIFGFGMGTERAIEPPRTDVKMLDNSAPVITEPYAVYYIKVMNY